MKPGTKHLIHLPAIIAGLALMMPGWVASQTFTTLHRFTSSITNGSDGPYAGLISSGNILYGTAFFGGTSENGAVFAVNADGTGYTNLYSFSAYDFEGFCCNTNSDGAHPYAGLILSGNTLYGTAAFGGGAANGTVFAVNTDGTGFTNLYSFSHTSYSVSHNDLTNRDGASPSAGLILSGNTLYGTAAAGGASGRGTVFAIHTNGTGFTNLHSFAAGASDSSGLYTNSDGASPQSELILSGNTLYGTAPGGGISGHGTVFAIQTDGTGFTNLHTFTATATVPGVPLTNSDGAYPVAGMILSGNTLYGTAEEGGSSENGTVFAVNTDGTDFATLHSFAAFDQNGYTNRDGAYPYAELILSGNTLYGTTIMGGSSGLGTVFAVNTNGIGFMTLYNFTGGLTNTDGTYPYAGLILTNCILYGTTRGGGGQDDGTIFSLSFGPRLTITPSGTDVILTWATNCDGFMLQSTTNLVSPSAWNTVSPGPVVVNGQNVVTNTLSGTQQFYRLAPPSFWPASPVSATGASTASGLNRSPPPEE